MTSKPGALPSDLASAYMALLAEREALQAERDVAVADAANARAELSDNEALIAHLELRIEKLKRELYGQRSERTARLIEQLELELEELVTTASEDELAAQAAAAKAQKVRAFTRQATGTQALAGRHRTRARRYRGSDDLRLLRRIAAGEDRRGCDQDAGGDPASLRRDHRSCSSADRE
jgi:Transposase C of IS166 homeodomain